MQRKRLIVTGVVVLILVAVGLFFEHEVPQSQVQQEADSERPAAKESTPPSHITQRLTNETPLNLDDKGKVEKNKSSEWRKAVKMAKEYASQVYSYRSSRNKEFDFYGKVIDQNMQPVVGATIELDIGYFDGRLTPAFFPSVYSVRLISDEDGTFSLVNQKAMGVSTTLIEKEGYKILNDGRRSFDFSHNDNPIPGNGPENPVLFKAWKSNPHQAIITGKISPKLIPDGRIYTIDFLKDKITAQEGKLGGDLHISFFREGTTRANGTSWNVSIEAVQGGVMETDDRYTYVAPESGYNNAWSYEIHRTKYRLPDKEAKFYFHSRNGGTYGSLNIRFVPFNSTDKARLHIEYRVNPNGSRILE